MKRMLSVVPNVENIEHAIRALQRVFEEQHLSAVDSIILKNGRSFSQIDILQQACLLVENAKDAFNAGKNSTAVSFVSMAVGCMMCTGLYSTKDLELLIK